MRLAPCAPGLTDAATKIELLSFIDLKSKHADAHLKLGLRRKCAACKEEKSESSGVGGAVAVRDVKMLVVMGAGSCPGCAVQDAVRSSRLSLTSDGRSSESAQPLSYRLSHYTTAAHLLTRDRCPLSSLEPLASLVARAPPPG